MVGSLAVVTTWLFPDDCMAKDEVMGIGSSTVAKVMAERVPEAL